jgi:hypothetical protein
MPLVTLKLPSWIAVKLGLKSSGWLSLETTVGENTCVVDVLNQMVATYPGFRESVYNPDIGLPTEQVNFFLNNLLLNYRDLSRIKLSDGDVIILIPLYTGG